jgi:3-oxoacyl-[acyl-carrier protein] reductase
MVLNGKVALMTGGSRGIGRAIANALADADADVAVNYKENKSAAEEVVAAITKSGRRAIAIGADVSVPQEVDSTITTITRQLGDIGILGNNAGVARRRSSRMLLSTCSTKRST